MVNTKPQAYLFVGDDNFLKEKAISELASSVLGDSSKDLDYKVYYGGESEPNEIISQINTIPFLASKRLVVIRHLEKTSPEFRSRLSSYLERPLKSTCLILEASGDSILGDPAGIASRASVRRFGQITAREILAWIKDALAAAGKKIAPEAATLLGEMHGQDLLSISQELDKLASFTGDRPEIRVADVEEIAGRGLVSSAFDLADAMGSGAADKAIGICADLLSHGKKEYEITGLLCWHLKRLLKARTLQARGESDNRVAAAVRISPKYRAEFFRQLSGFSVARLKAGIKTLLEADLDIKRTRFDPTLVLEFALISLCRRASS